MGPQIPDLRERERSEIRDQRLEQTSEKERGGAAHLLGGGLAECLEAVHLVIYVCLRVRELGVLLDDCVEVHLGLRVGGLVWFGLVDEKERKKKRKKKKRKKKEERKSVQSYLQRNHLDSGEENVSVGRGETQNILLHG
jgi:hypothetical protein